MEKNTTSDLNFTAYLISQGFKVESTRQSGRFTEFIFSESIEKEETAWQFDPSEKMKVVQAYVVEKEKLLTFLKTKQRREKWSKLLKTKL